MRKLLHLCVNWKKKKTQKAPLRWGERALRQGARLGQWGAIWTPTSTHLLYCAHWLGNLFRKDCCVLCVYVGVCLHTQHLCFGITVLVYVMS